MGDWDHIGYVFADVVWIGCGFLLAGGVIGGMIVWIVMR